MKTLKLLKVFLPLLILSGIGYFLWQGLSLNPRIVPSVLLNEQTPEFNLPNLLHPGAKLGNKIFKGHVSLLNVWATWCAACINEYPLMINIAHTHKVKIYGLDYKDDRTKALVWIKKYGNAYAAIGFDETGETAINWGVYGTPETFVINKNGVIKYKQIGEVTPEVWKHTLLPLIEKLEKEKNS